MEQIKKVPVLWTAPEYTIGRRLYSSPCFGGNLGPGIYLWSDFDTLSRSSSPLCHHYLLSSIIALAWEFFYLVVLLSTLFLQWYVTVGIPTSELFNYILRLSFWCGFLLSNYFVQILSTCILWCNILVVIKELVHHGTSSNCMKQSLEFRTH